VPGPRAPLAVRFWAKVDCSGGLFSCWPWTGAVVNRYRLGHDGRYGHLARGPRGAGQIKAHRLALILATGEDRGPGWEVLHDPRCTTTLCCNPAHLRWGDRLENIKDIIRRAALSAVEEQRDSR
jgi:hypothetical protein